MASAREDVTRIIPMTDECIDDVVAVYNKLQATRSAYTKRSQHLTEGNALTHEQIASTGLGSELDLSFMYELNGKVVGFVWGRLAYVGIPVQQVGFIHMIIVDPDLQRKGIARELVDAVAQRCSEKGVDTIRTVVGEKDWELSTFFNEVGFQNSGLLIYTRTVKI